MIQIKENNQLIATMYSSKEADESVEADNLILLLSHFEGSLDANTFNIKRIRQ